MPFARVYSLLSLALLLVLAGCASKDVAPPPSRPCKGHVTGACADSLLRPAIHRNSLPLWRQLTGWSGLLWPGRNDLPRSRITCAPHGGRPVPCSATGRYPRPGDLLFFGEGSKATHVGIYGGNRQMIHAPGSGRAVVSVPLDIDYWQQRFLGAASMAP